MSWSFQKNGTPHEVLATLQDQRHAQSKLADPEESMRGKVFDVIAHSILAWPESEPVNVQSWGSQTTKEDGTIKATVHLDISVP